MNHQQQFAALSEVLIAHRDLWQPRAFKHTALPWQGYWPDLDHWLDGLSLAESEALATDNGGLLAALAPRLPVAQTLQTLIALPRRHARVLNLPARVSTDVPGRKWAQVQAFVGNLDNRALPWLEWCAGKGHLGRCLHLSNGQAVLGLEWQQALVNAGNALAQRLDLAVTLHQRDVLAAVPELRGPQHVVALHACGDLHLRLLSLAVERLSPAVSLSPCCYHLIKADSYQPLSAAAQRTALPLSVEDLRTAVQETVTAPARVNRQRRQLQGWRLGFDALQRDVRGDDHYLPVPSLGPEWLHQGFEAFCRHCATLKQLPLPDAVNWARYAELGEQRLRQVAAQDLVRLAFRRALELWLVLDRALFLEEQGYEVAVFEFCERSLTPRNILVDAFRSGL